MGGGGGGGGSTKQLCNFQRPSWSQVASYTFPPPPPPKKKISYMRISESCFFLPQTIKPQTKLHKTLWKTVRRTTCSGIKNLHLCNKVKTKPEICKHVSVAVAY